MRFSRGGACLLVSAMVLLSSGVVPRMRADGARLFNEGVLDSFTFRNLGPFRAGAWISDIAVPEHPAAAHLYTFYVAARTGGVWKTTNNGTTFEPVFDRQNVTAVGALAIAPSNPDIVWVGTGGADNARSSYSGDGVYRSSDAGRTWSCVGLADSHHIARIVIHPSNPDIVYIAAMGHLFTSNEERGVFKTSDGGKSWKKVLYINDKVGVIDLALDRRAPETLYAATYEKYRYPWGYVEGGPESGIYKTTDGGNRWKRLTRGLPGGTIGRIGLDTYRKNPRVLYAIVENANRRAATEQEMQEGRGRGGQAAAARPIGGEVYRTDDSGETWRKVNPPNVNVGGKAPYSFNQIRVDPNNDQRVFVTSETVVNSEDGGKTWHDNNWPSRNIFPHMFGDVRTFWIDPENSNRLFLGSDGGVQVSYDGGKTNDFYDNLPLGEWYAVDVDMADPYNIYAGLQDHESWRAPSNSWRGRISLEDWITTGTGDGMYNRVDRTNNRWMYNTLSFGGHQRVDLVNRVRTSIAPRRPAGQPPLRFNWVAPIVISPHNSQIIYAGAQVLFRSFDRGDHWQEISPDLTTNDPAKVAGVGGRIPFCTITTISESPVTPGVIWVGADDGKVQITRNGGATWSDVTEAIASAGGPKELWVSRVFASNAGAGTAYISKTGYRADDVRPLLFKTTDFGQTWSRIVDGLPQRPINVVVEDAKNQNLLFVGTDGGLFVSIDAGAHWVRMRANMPAAPVHDLVIHPRENDLVVATYGRGAWVTEITTLQQMSEKLLDEEVHLFDVKPRARVENRAWGNYELYGDRHITPPNEPNALTIAYYLKESSPEKAVITITDAAGTIVRTIEGESRSGINRVLWSMDDKDRHPMPVGEYVVMLKTGNHSLTTKARIRDTLRPES